MKNKKVISIFVIVMIAAVSAAIFLFTGTTSYDIAYYDDEEVEPAIPRNTVTFIAAGDNLFHYSILRAHRQDDDSYYFTPIYQYIKPIVQAADLAFINQETIMGGTRFGYTGWPRFNTPQALGYVLAETGFHVVNLANNHAMDRGEAALLATLDFLDTIEELTVIGARREGESARIIEKNNITLGFLAYTFSLNGIPLPPHNLNLVSMINREVMAREIAALRPLVDFLIVSMHWGEEYLLEPDRSQTSLAQFLAQQEVDLVIGHHPHVLQRVETIPTPSGRETIVFYSLGNFVSNQRERERLIGGMAVLTFVKEGLTCEDGEFTGELYITDVGKLPVVTHFDLNIRNYRIYPLWMYNQELLENHGFRRYDMQGFTMEFFYSVLDRVQTDIIMKNPFADHNLDYYYYS